MPVAEIAIQLYERGKNYIPLVLADLIPVLSYWMWNHESRLHFLLIWVKHLLCTFFYSRIKLYRRDIYLLINSFFIFPLPPLSQYQPLKNTLIVLWMRMFFFFPLPELFPLYKSRCLERQCAFRLLENSYVIVFEKASSYKKLLNVFLNIFNFQLEGRRHGSNQI